MKGRLTRGEGAGVAAVSYAVVVGAHVSLPGPAPFALFLLVAAPAMVVLVTRTAGVRGTGPAPRCGRDPFARRSSATGACRDAAATGPGGRTGHVMDDEYVPATGVSAGAEGLDAMRATLAGLEGELHALEDQRLTELARMNGEAR